MSQQGGHYHPRHPRSYQRMTHLAGRVHRWARDRPLFTTSHSIFVNRCKPTLAGCVQNQDQMAAVRRDGECCRNHSSCVQACGCQTSGARTQTAGFTRHLLSIPSYPSMCSPAVCWSCPQRSVCSAQHLRSEQASATATDQRSEMKGSVMVPSVGDQPV